MVAKAKTIEIEPGSETARLLDEADRTSLVLVVGGRTIPGRAGNCRQAARVQPMG
jgi:hypothetical protein